MTPQKIDIAIINGKVVGSQSITAADVLIDKGRITAVASPGVPVHANRIIDAAGNFVLPGIIDAHLHPVYADRIDTLSRAAVREGVTTLIPYIGAVKAWGQRGGLTAAVENFIAEGESTSLIDFSLHCTLMQDDLAGSLQPGADADLVVFDSSMEYIIGETHPELNVDFSLYAGRRGTGAPVLTMQRGAILFEDNQIKAVAGQGEYLAATSPAAVSLRNR